MWHRENLEAIDPLLSKDYYSWQIGIEKKLPADEYNTLKSYSIYVFNNKKEVEDSA